MRALFLLDGRNTFLLFIVLFFSNVCNSQDIIYKKDGSEISAKVLEIDELIIKYKNWDQQEGPIRNIQKSQVFMIKYQDGIVEKFTTAQKSLGDSLKNQETLRNNTIQQQSAGMYSKDYIDMQLHRATSIQRTGDILLGIGSLSCIIAPILMNAKSNVGYVFAGIGLASFITGLPFHFAGKAQYKKWSKMKADISFFIQPSSIKRTESFYSQYNNFSLCLRVTF